MKNRLSKSINRLKKEKKISNENQDDLKGLSSFNIKVFRSLSDKYDLSLTINENSLIDEENEKNLSLGAQITMERIKKGEDFKP